MELISETFIFQYRPANSEPSVGAQEQSRVNSLSLGFDFLLGFLSWNAVVLQVGYLFCLYRVRQADRCGLGIDYWQQKGMAILTNFCIFIIRFSNLTKWKIIFPLCLLPFSVF